ncbi:MAG: anthranilate phosphoribosyltransferase [Acidimicrobiia bacterium]
MRALIERLLAGSDLSGEEAALLLEGLTDPSLDPAQAAAALAGLRAKGETAEELRAFALGLRRMAVETGIPADVAAVDVVGTGGDGSHSLNLSTGAALVAAAAGQPVVKHGNRSVSSRSGSFDVLSALGMGVPGAPPEAARLFAETGFTYLFAPIYHPAMKAVAPVRRALGVRTIFNLAGPLANPASPPYHVVGAYSPSSARMLAETLAGMPLRRAYVIHGAPGWDEPTPVGPYLLLEVTPGKVEERTEDPARFGLEPCSPDQLAGGDPHYNAAALLRVLEGERGPHRDALLLGASLALRVTRRVPSPEQALAAAAAAIDDGRALALVQRLAAEAANV